MEEDKDYLVIDIPNTEEQTEKICPTNFGDYCHYLYTNTNHSTTQTHEEFSSTSTNVITILCCPIKFVLLLPCLFGTVINSTANCIANTNKNYLF